MNSPETMIERMARVICWHAYKVSLSDSGRKVLRIGCPRDLDCRKAGHCRERQSLIGSTIYYVAASAALAALREPSEGMIEAYGKIPFALKTAWQEDGRTIFQAMIDAALAETP